MVRHFTEATPVRGESSPNYTRFPIYAGVVERMYDLLPDARLGYCVRNPLERSVSHYLHRLLAARFGRAPKPMPSVQRRRRSPLKSWWLRRNLSGVYWAERNFPWLFGPPLTQPELPPELYARLHRLWRGTRAGWRRFPGTRSPACTGRRRRLNRRRMGDKTDFWGAHHAKAHTRQNRV